MAAKPSEEVILGQLAQLYARRDVAAKSLAIIDEKIKAQTTALAKKRGVCFLRQEVVRREAEGA